MSTIPAPWRELFADLAACEAFPELRRLCRKSRRLEAESGPPPGVDVRLALLGGATTDLLLEPLRLALLARGVRPEIHVGGFNQFATEMRDPTGELTAFRPRVAVVVSTPFNVPRWPDRAATLDDVEPMVDEACAFLLEPCDALHAATGAEIVLNNLHTPPGGSLGNLGGKAPGDPRNFVRRVNLALGDRAPGHVHVNDVAALVEEHGLARWLDLRYWYEAKQPVSFDAVAEYARNTAAVVGAVLGRSRKVVVVDLDNTLWGGVIGDEGVGGIDVGEGSARGEAFKAFQAYLASLRDTGVLLAVSSKNDEEVALAPFAEHPEMLLRRDDFVAFRANWEPKPDNLRAIARQLDLGLDSFVFVDDNPAEREFVRRELPEVAVAEIGEDPADYVRVLEAGRHFERVALTAEDRKRTDTYRTRAAAAAELEQATDMPTFLRSLEMVAVVGPFDDVSLQRVTQLTNKTNQFNLTTQRVTQSEMRAMTEDPRCLTRSLRLRDKFGDHGIVAVLFAHQDDTALTIDNWLMSCRVLKRGAEYALFESVLAEARSRGVSEIVGAFRPTDRNGMVADHYAGLGFVLETEHEGATTWRLTVADAVVPEHFIAFETEVTP